MTGVFTPSTSIPAMVEANALEIGSRTAVTWKEGGVTHSVSWSAYRSVIIDAASALLDIGIEVGDTIAILAPNRVEHLIIDHAATHVRATPVSLYPSLSQEQFQHVLADSNPHILFVENEEVADKLRATPWFAERVPLVVVFSANADPRSTSWSDFVSRGVSCRSDRAAELETRVSQIELTDLATIIYTSGTTGAPKGVNLTNSNVLWNADAFVKAGFVDYDYSNVSFLPLAHIVERLWSIYLAARTGGHVFCCPNPDDLLSALQEHRPTYFMAVPRVWEKLAGAVDAIIASPAFDGRREQIEEDRKTLVREWETRFAGQPVDVQLEMDAVRARRGLRDVRVMLGLERSWPSSAAAAMRPATMQHFASIGLTITQGYGLTETAGPVTCEPRDYVSGGAVGILMPDYEARIASDGEILVRGPGNTSGYRNLPEATAELIDSDGWLRTGDVGRIDEGGQLYITDRKKELIVTAAGKNVSPQAIENQLAGVSLIAQIVAIGDGRPYVVALITPNEGRLAAFAADHGLSDLPRDQLIEHPTVVAEVSKQVEAANATLSRPEQVKRFRILPEQFTTDQGTLTPTFKIKRRIVDVQFAAAIDGLYETASSQAHPATP